MPKSEEPLVFIGLGPRALCEQVKDPDRNGGKYMAALRKHLDTPLVRWGRNPGFGRTPYATFVSVWEPWAGRGRPVSQLT